MYERANTWLENGPSSAMQAAAPRVVVVPSLYRLKRAAFARRGVGALPQLSQQYCDSYWSLLNPVAWAGGCALRDAANVYEKIQYGHIPRPAELPPPPLPSVVTQPGQLPTIDAAAMAAWTKSQRDAIQAAEDSGAYNPEGNLPVDALDLARFWDRYGTAVMIAGVGVLGFVGYKAATR